jgi:hypothetical protein
MDSNLVYAKTPTGDEAVRQSTRVVQRNLRMVLVQVDGKTSVEELSAKIGNPRLVRSALQELEEGGFVAPTIEAVSVWEESKKAAKRETEVEAEAEKELPPMSQFSTFGPKSLGAPDSRKTESAASNFSSFGKPILPSSSPSIGEPERQVAVAVAASEVRSYRQGISTGRKVALATIGVLAVAAATIIFYPYERFKPGIEAAATKMLETPVRIGAVGVSLFPSPSLRLTGVDVGGMGDGKISEVRISSPLSLLGSPPYQVARIDVSGASLPADRLVALPMFVNEAGAGQEVVARKMMIDHLHVTLGNSVALNDIFGEIVFRPDGGIEKATFETVDRSILVSAQPSSQGIALSIDGRAWTPQGTKVSFASLQAKGLLQKNKLLIQNIDTTFLGGILRGNWLLEWGNGLSMAGDATLSRLDARKVSEALVPSLKLEGDISGSLRLRSGGADWDSLWENVEAVTTTEITRGVFHGVDLGEAVRRSGLEVRAGSTKFDRLRSNINVTPKQVTARDVRMDAGMMTAAGQFSSNRNGQVDGTMSVTLQTSVSSQNGLVRVYGILPDLSATTKK